MPKRILIIGIAFIVTGSLAISGMVYQATQVELNINLGAFMLPVGIGVLRGRAGSQWWARFWIIINCVSFAALACGSLISPANLRFSWSGEKVVEGDRAVPYSIAASAIFLLLLAVAHRLLYSRRACAWFRRY